MVRVSQKPLGPSCEQDLVRIWRFLLSTLLLALFLALAAAAIVVTTSILSPLHCGSVLTFFHSSQLAAAWRNELLAHSRARSHHDPNLKLQEDINAYLQHHSSADHMYYTPIQIHFITVTNKTDWSLCMLTASCALAGVPLKILGSGSPYSHVWRFERYLEYIDKEGLRDEDIVVTLDADVSWTGTDVLPFLQKFARYSPATEAALDLAAVRAWEDYGGALAPEDIDALHPQLPGRNPLRMQVAPIIFNADDDCYYYQPSDRFFNCFAGDYVLQHLIAAARNGASSFSLSSAAVASKETLESFKKKYDTFFGDGIGHRLLNTSLEGTSFLRAPNSTLFYDGAITKGRNPAHYLNAGMHVSRVWALRELAKGVLRFAREQKAPTKGEWFCDQSIIGILRYHSRIFEINRGLLFTDGHQEDGRLVRDPLGLPVGLMAIDRNTEFMLTSHLRYRKGFGKFTPFFYSYRDKGCDSVPSRDLTAVRSGALITPPLLGCEIFPRCIDLRLLNTSISKSCSSSTPRLVFPSFLHFAAGSKRELYITYRRWFAWYFAARHSNKAFTAAMAVLNKLNIQLWYADGVQKILFADLCPSPFHS